MSKSSRIGTIIIAAFLLAVIIIGGYLILRKLPPTSRTAVGRVSTFAGRGQQSLDDGASTSASFRDPFGIAIDLNGSVIIADGGSSNRIRRISKGIVETVGGSSEGFDDGAALSAMFNTPSGLAIGPDGDIIIADTSNNSIRILSGNGLVRTLAGTGERGFRDGSAQEAQFDAPIGVAVDAGENVFVADTYNDAIRKVSVDGVVTTLAGGAGQGLSDGIGVAALFNTPCGLAIDKQGKLYVADTGNNLIRLVSPAGEVTTFAGGQRGHSDGTGTGAQFDHPVGLALTHDGFLFVADEGSGLIRRITPEGEVQTIAGQRSGYSEGVGSHARFNGPTGIAVGRDGAAYVADSQNYLIRRIEMVEPGQFIEPEPANELFIQPALTGSAGRFPAIPQFSIGSNLPWPLFPQDQWHEVTGVVGEARGAPGGIALDHLHSGADIRANMGETVLSVVDEKVSSPIPSWDYGESSEGIQVGAVSYIHVKIGRDRDDRIFNASIFKPELGQDSKPVGIRVRRGTRFRIGDPIGTINRLYHVHLNIGPWNAQLNPLVYGFPGFVDTIPPVIENIEILSSTGDAFTTKRDGRLVVHGDVDIVVTAYDRADGNVSYRRLGLYSAGYQLLKEDGATVPDFEQPLINIEFNRLPADEDVAMIYAPGSGVSAYGGSTRFRYIVTNRVRDGLSIDGVLRTSQLDAGTYILKVFAADLAGNQITSELRIWIDRPAQAQ